MTKSSSMAAFAGVFAVLVLAHAVHAQERAKTSKVVKVQVQGGGGVQPEAGAPPAVEPSISGQPAAASVAPTGAGLPVPAAAGTIRAVETGDGEATLEVDGRREVIRPGSRLRGDRVRSITPGRIVLERPGPTGSDRAAALVVLTFDQAGRGTSRVFWTFYISRHSEVKRP
jgi:hypothetical protein